MSKLTKQTIARETEGLSTQAAQGNKLKRAVYKAKAYGYGLCGMVSTMALPSMAIAQSDHLTNPNEPFKPKKFVNTYYGDKDDHFVHDIGVELKGSGRIIALTVSVIAFLWISYAAIAKFRECQKGMADWSELMVLGVAAAATLVFATILLSSGTDPLVSSEE